MKLIQPLVEEVKKVYPEIQQLSNDALRAKTKEILNERVRIAKDAAASVQIKLNNPSIADITPTQISLASSNLRIETGTVMIFFNVSSVYS